MNQRILMRRKAEEAEIVTLRNAKVKLGERVAYYRARRGWDQDKLGSETGVHRATINRIENANGRGILSMSVEGFLKLAKGLGEKPSELLKRIEL